MSYELNFTPTCEAWLEERRQKDRSTQTRILARIFRMSEGNFGDAKPVGEGVSELRIDFGPGYRVYYTIKGKEVVVVLCGGDKKSQVADIKEAKGLAREL